MPLTSPFLFGGERPGKRGPLGHLPLNALKNPYVPRVSRVALMVFRLGPPLRSGPPVSNLLSQGLGFVFALARMGVDSLHHPHSRPPVMSSIVRTMIGYHTSTDYDALWELAQRQSVVCLVLYQKEMLDVAQTIAIPNGKGGWSIDISCRGTGYIQGWDRAAFIQQCEKAQVQWLIPQERS